MDCFEEAQKKSHYIVQYKCCGTWWGASKNNKCRDCGETVAPLPLWKMVGVGWFQCSCSRVYAGFIRGNVTSKCHSCNTENLPSFIVPGDDAARAEGKAKKAHYCAVCRGQGSCPIVASAKANGSRGRRYQIVCTRRPANGAPFYDCMILFQS
jgi:hypothetical protein